MFSSCLRRDRTPEDSQKWYHQPQTPYTASRSGKYYKAQPKTSHTKTKTQYSITMNLGKTNANSTITPSSILENDKKISAFYNERSLMKEVDMVESQQKELIRLRHQNQELKQMVKDLTPIKDKYNRLRQQYIKKQKELEVMQTRMSELERFRRFNS